MSKYTVLGIIFWLGGFVLVIFQGMSIKAGTKEVWMTLSIADIAGRQYFQWIDSISWLFFQQIVNFLISLPLCASLFIIGLIMFVIDGSNRT